MATRQDRRQAAIELTDLREDYDNIVSQMRYIAEQLPDKHALVYIIEHMESLSQASNRFESSLETWIAELEDPNEDEEDAEPDDDGCDYDHPERLVGEPR